MPVRKTESRIPLGFVAGDLGEAAAAPDGRCALVSFITSPLVVNRENVYVVFVTDVGLAAVAQSFEWSFSENGGTAVTQSTTVGQAVYSPQETGSLVTIVRILDAASTEQANLSLTQAMVPPNAELEALIVAATDQPGPGASNPVVSRELVNDHNPYYQAVTPPTPETGDAFQQFVFTVAVDGVSQITPDGRKKLAEDLAQKLRRRRRRQFYQSDFARARRMRHTTGTAGHNAAGGRAADPVDRASATGIAKRVRGRKAA